MGFFKTLFGERSKGKEEKVLPWIPLKSDAQLNLINQKSKIKTQLIFKHSTRCGISAMVMNQFVDSYNFTDKNFDLYYLDLLSYREISDELSYKYQVMHQSPQLLIVKNGIAVAHASHSDINSLDLKKYL